MITASILSASNSPLSPTRSSTRLTATAKCSEVEVFVSDTATVVDDTSFNGVARDKAV